MRQDQNVVSPHAATSLFRLTQPGIPGGDYAPMPAFATRSRVFHVHADFRRDGAWSGARDLVEAAFLDLETRGESALIAKHNYELNRVLPTHRHRIPLKHACLTDTAEGTERTRNYPLDRAYRLVHGLIGLIIAWKQMIAPEQSWLVAVEGYADAQHLGRRFFAELARRGALGGVIVLVDTAVQSEVPAFPALRIEFNDSGLSLDTLGLSPLPAHQPDEAGLAAIHEALRTHRISNWEDHYPTLLAHYRRKGEILEAARVALRALCINNHYGYYHESASFIDSVLPYFEELIGDDQINRWDYVGNFFTGLATTGREEQALRIVLERAEPHITLDEYRAKMHYLLSMTYLRYLKIPDMARAEQHILAAMDAIEAAKGEAKREDYVFLKVFIGNGLAFLRVRQGQHDEALRLCQSGYELLTYELGEEQHMLHRSVLQYNTAQVYALLGRGEDAMAYYHKAIEMDPHYSEYYNEIGNILQRDQRFEEAARMYDLAIEYSAPYPEVHFNKGVCLLNLGSADDAIACFDTSLELNPLQPDVYALRAELREEAGDRGGALADYDATIALSPDAVAPRVNRAVLHFESGRYDLALADMDRVIALEPAVAEHYLNRAEIHKATAQRELYQRDLDAAEACEPSSA
jgi:tetratricopeptide (TPR) repeat protein